MERFTELSYTRWNPVFDSIGRDWMLISVSDGTRENVMTASWGGIGVIWNRPVAVCLIRPERFSFSLMEKSERFALSGLPQDRRDALTFCGRESGRDHADKFAAAGLSVLHDGGVPYPAEAETVLLCRKLYASDLRAEQFLDPDIPRACYSTGGLHRVYVGEIEKVLKKG